MKQTFVFKPKSNERRINSPFCPGCFYLGQKLNTAVHFKHLPSECPREPAVVKLVQAENDIIEDVDDLNLENNGNIDIQFAHNNSHAKVKKNTEANSESCFINSFCQDFSKINSIVVNVSSIMAKYRSVRKEKSPSLTCKLNESVMVCLIDEGSEINCLSNEFVLKNSIPVVEVECKAVGAGKAPMNVIGMTKYDVIVSIVGTRVPVNINLGHMIVIQNLGVVAQTNYSVQRYSRKRTQGQLSIEE